MTRGTEMTITHNRKRFIAGALMSAGVALAGLGLAEGTAQALPQVPVPLGSLARSPSDNPSGPCHSVPRRSSGEEPATFLGTRPPGQQRVPHLLVCLSRAGQRRSEHFRG